MVKFFHNGLSLCPRVSGSMTLIKWNILLQFTVKFTTEVVKFEVKEKEKTRKLQRKRKEKNFFE